MKFLTAYQRERAKLTCRYVRELSSALLFFNLCPWVDGFGDFRIQGKMVGIFSDYIRQAYFPAKCRDI